MIVITVPHAVCIGDNNDHSCDSIAPQVANMFHEKLGRVPHTVLYGNINRDTIDLNRKVSRDTDFRRMVRSYYDQAKVLFDVHSFPPDDPGPYEGIDIAIATEHDPEEEYLCPLSDHLYEEGIKNHVVGGITGDIIQEAKENDIQAFLFEFREGLTNDDLEDIVEKIVEYFVPNEDDEDYGDSP